VPQLYFIKTDDESLVHLYEVPSYKEKCNRLLQPNDVVFALDVVRMDDRYKSEPLRLVLSKFGVGWVGTQFIRRLV
jgi:hypothetical protein